MSSGILKWGIPKTIGFNTNMVGWLGWFGGATIWGNLHTLIKQFRGAPYFQTNPKIGKNAKKNWEYHQPKCRYSSTKTGYWWSQILFSSIVVVTMIPNKCWVLNQCIYIYIATSCDLPNNKGEQLHTLQWTYVATMWHPPVISYFITPSTIDIPTISPSEIGVICTNLVSNWGTTL